MNGQEAALWWSKQPKQYNYKDITQEMFYEWYKHSDPLRMKQLVPYNKALAEFINIPSYIKINYENE